MIFSKYLSLGLQGFFFEKDDKKSINQIAMSSTTVVVTT